MFVFFGLAAVAGTAYVQMDSLTWLALAAAVPVGLLACALLVINNLRDIPTDTVSGKRTLAVLAGDAADPAAVRGLRAGAVRGRGRPSPPARPLALLVFAGRAAAGPGPGPARSAARGGRPGPDRACSAMTGRLQLAFGALLTLGLAIRF